MNPPGQHRGMAAGTLPAGIPPERLTHAHVVPFAVFLGFLLVLQLVVALIGWDHPEAPWWRRDPAHVIYPLQSLVCLGLLFHFRGCYRFDWSWKWLPAAVVFGTAGIAAWLLPTTLYDHWRLESEPTGPLAWLGVKARTDGFNPWIFDHPAAVWTTAAFRFLRAVVVVAFVEEIFWRGFLMRFVHDREGDYWRQPFGRAGWMSYAVVTLLFMLAHSPDDYAGAFVYGSLTWLLCVWSRNLGACVIMHATANLLLGCYVMAYGKFGLW